MLKFVFAVVALIVVLVVGAFVFADTSDAAHKRNGDYIGRVKGDDSRFFNVRRYYAEGGIYSIWVTTRTGKRHLYKGYNLDLVPHGFRVNNRRSKQIRVYIQTYDDARRKGLFG